MRIQSDVTSGFGEWTVDGHPQSIQFSRSFWEDILPAVMADFLRLPWGGPEIGGVLFGNREPGRVSIRAFRPLECDHDNGPAFELSERDASRLRDLLDEAKTDQDLAGLEAVGWYHSKHHWLVLTPQDLELYDRYFPEPWQIAMVFLRLRSQPCLLGLFFRREDGSIASCHSEFSVREPAPPATEPEPEPEPQPAPEHVLESQPEPEPEPEPMPVPELEPEPEPTPAPEAAPVAQEVAPLQKTCCAFWGLSEKPFAHPASPYWNHQSEDVLSRLMRAVRGRSGLMVLTGEAGTGKTTLLGRLGDYLTREPTEFAFLLDSRLTAEQFYEFLAYDLALPCPRRSKVAILKSLQDLLLEQAGRGRTSALVIDDAHHLDWEVFEEIRMLDNLQHRTGRLLQTILCGSPELDQRLESDELRLLRERVTVRCSLQPLREEETAECIRKRLADCGMPDQTAFAPEILSAIHARSGGVLRVTGLICDGLLECCAARGSRAATLEMLDEVCSVVHSETGGG